jgi:putative hydrolase of the HAD superfamily
MSSSKPNSTTVQSAARLTGIKIVFFDLDDTLCAYWEASKKALIDTFEAHTLPGRSASEMMTTWADAFRDFVPTLKKTGWYETYLKNGEVTRTEQMRLMLRRFGLEDDAMAQRLSDSYGKKRNDNLALFDESMEVLESLFQRFPLGLVTNGPADVQREEIETLGIGHFFKHVYIEGEMGRGKPLPEVFEQIRQDVGFQPHEILFVGNSYHHDVKPGIAAGWHTIWVRKESDVPPSSSAAIPEQLSLEEPQPDAIVEDLRDVLAILGVA